MEQGRKELYRAQNQFQTQKADNLYYLSGNLGFMINSQQKVEVVGRSGFVYVRLRSNTSEVIQAYDDKVALVYDLPVLVARDKINTNRYYVVGIDSQKYGTWQSSYIAKHGSQHSFNPPLEGGDPVWVYGRQFMPLAPFPSGTSGGMGIVISPYSFYSPTDSTWKYISTGTVSLSAYKPTDNQSRMVLVYSNSIGNVGFKSGSLFTSSVTGTSEILPYVPGLSYGEIPIGGIRLTSGTSTISWDNIYDLRPYYSPYSNPTTNFETITVGTSSGTVTLDTTGVHLAGRATVWEDLQVPGLGVRLQGSNDPTLDVFQGASRLYAFPNGSMKEVFVSLQFPHATKSNSAVRPHVHYAGNVSGGTGTVQWGLEYDWQPLNGFFTGSTTTIYLTDVVGAAKKHQIASFAGITGTNMGLSSMFVGRLFRNGGSASDHYADKAFLLGFDIHYERDSEGSDEEFVK